MVEKKRLHVGMVITYDLCEPGGGVKKHAQQLAESLRQAGDRVTLFGPSSRPINEENVTGFRGVIDVSSNGSGNRIGILVSPFKFSKFIRSHAFDILHIHEPLPPIISYYAAWMTPGIPKIATFHAYSERSTRMLLFARRLFAPFVLPYIHRAIAVSEPAARHAQIDWKGPLCVIPNGIHTHAFPPGAHRGNDGSITRLLFVGKTTDARKGYAYLVEATSLARDRGIRLELHVVGELPRRQSDVPPFVIRHGPLGEEKLAELYQSCDVFVSPSTGQESFGVVLLEAMSAARPIICSNIDGYRQVVNPEGTLLVPPRDTSALADAIIELASSSTRRREMGESNADYVKRFEWSVLAPRVREEYLRTITEHRLALEEARRLRLGVVRVPLSLPRASNPLFQIERTERRRTDG